MDAALWGEAVNLRAQTETVLHLGPVHWGKPRRWPVLFVFASVLLKKRRGDPLPRADRMIDMPLLRGWYHVGNAYVTAQGWHSGESARSDSPPQTSV